MSWIHNTSKKIHIFLQVLEAKKYTYPDNISILEYKCEVILQDLLNHTVKRLLEYLDISFPQDKLTKLELKLKYGFDGTAANSYNQRWKDNNNSDEHIFCTSLVPLQLEDSENHEILWRNPRPSSTRFCRPIRIQYVRETTVICKEEELHMKQQIENLMDFKGNNFSVKFNLSLTMIDGKVRIHNIAISF